MFGIVDDLQTVGDDTMHQMCVHLCPGVQPPDQPNMAFWQLTADLPFTLELTFLGGHSDVGGQLTAHKAHI